MHIFVDYLTAKKVIIPSTIHIAVNCRILGYQLEGIGWYTYEIVKHWIKNDHRIRLSLLFDRPTDHFQEENIESHIIGPLTSHTPSIFYWNEVSVSRWLKRHQPDFYFSPDGFIPLRSKVPCIPVVHDLAPLVYPQHMRWRDYWYYRIFQYKMIQRAPFLFTVSKFSKNEITNKCPRINADKIFISYNGLNTAFSSILNHSDTKLNKDQPPPYFLYYGSIHPRKNVVGLIRSFEIYRNRGGQAKLIICGRKAWKASSIEEVASTTPSYDHLTWLPYLGNEKLVPLLQGALALIYISHYEGFGLPVLEAMATGVPTITSSDSSMEEIGGNAVLLSDPLDHEQVARHMKNIAENPDLRNRIIKIGKEQAEKFDYKISAEYILSIFKRKLNEN